MKTSKTRPITILSSCFAVDKVKMLYIRDLYYTIVDNELKLGTFIFFKLGEKESLMHGGSVTRVVDKLLF